MNIETINPVTGQIIASYPLHSDLQIQQILSDGHQAFLAWRRTALPDRAVFLQNMAALLKKYDQELANLITLEMGKPIVQAKAEIHKCAWLCEHYAGQGVHYLQGRETATDMLAAKVIYQPLGIIFSIMPWNFPFWQVMRCAVPAMMAGNGVLLRHAPNTTGCGQRLEQLFLEAGFPKYLLQQVMISNEMTESIIASPYVGGVSFTGSVRTGKIIAGLAGKYLKPAVLELGGNDPYIVLDDADFSLAAQCIVQSRLNNCGQVCIAAKRIFVSQKNHSLLLEKIQNLLPAYHMGNPASEQCHLGPLARADLRETVHQQVLKTVEEGAHLLMGGVMLEGEGFYYPVTILDNVRPGMTAFKEEIFGPVISLITFQNLEEAIALANQSAYGLTASIFTEDRKQGDYIASELIEAGACFVNKQVSSDPRLPFGGIKESGFGRELSREGILSFVNVKTVALN